MKFYLVQHGKALSKEENEARPLSNEGKKEIENISSFLRQSCIEIEKVFHSGKLRAKETAEIFSKQVSDGGVYQIEGMNPNDDVVDFSRCLIDNAMYVGHLPFMGKLVSLLLSNSIDSQILKYQNGGAVCIHSNDTGYHIRWYITPELC